MLLPSKFLFLKSTNHTVQHSWHWPAPGAEDGQWWSQVNIIWPSSTGPDKCVAVFTQSLWCQWSVSCVTVFYNAAPRLTPGYRTPVQAWRCMMEHDDGTLETSLMPPLSWRCLNPQSQDSVTKIVFLLTCDNDDHDDHDNSEEDDDDDNNSEDDNLTNLTIA